MTTRRSLVLATAFAFLLAIGSIGVAASTPAASQIGTTQIGTTQVGTTYHRTELYFGGTRPDGTDITAADFDVFLAKSVTPAFPAGLTLLTGRGQWQDATGLVTKQPSYVLILLYPLDDRTANARVEQIRRDYLKAFDQKSVLRTDSTERVSF